MPKAAPFVPKPAIEKLPLAVRKDIRDNYEAEKEDFETAISELLGSPFHVNINAGEVWAYNSDSGTSAGGLLKRLAIYIGGIRLIADLHLFTSYVEGFIEALKWYIEKFGDEGKTHFNEAVTQSELTLNANELGDKAETIDADVKDGVFRILFNHTKLGYNQSYLRDYLLKAVESVPRAGFSIVAKNSIEEHYNSEIEDVTTEIGEILAIPDVVLDPNFEANYEALGAVNKDTDWHQNFGKATFAYFNDGLKYQLERQGFKGDEMLQEGFAEVVTSKTFQIRIVKKTKNDATLETVVEDGTVYIQMTAQKWWYNVSDGGSGLIDLL
ncbi:hypothetical protein DXG01_012642 [Tephrocybe rancida]|nr:hypothetical protein DXG01_012642 [Tephrocybe rancida]